MKLAIHHRKGSFSERWIDYCKQNNIDFLIVDCYQNDIIKTLKDNQITHFMWHFSHSSYIDKELFHNVMNSADKLGIKTYPNFDTRWHFDDKVAQKYLLESIEAPLVKTFVFYDKKQASEFIQNYTLPIVAKLKRGAGSANVKLLKSKNQALNYINKMFSKGESPLSKTFENLDSKKRIAKKYSKLELIKKVFSYIKRNIKERKYNPREIGYVYFQEFIPDNDFDTRVVVVDNIAFAIRRLNKENDFRASGSGKIDYDISKIDVNLIKIAFEINEKLKAQTVAYDFVYKNGEPKLIEVCFGFTANAYDNCEGYWDKSLTFHKEKFNPQAMMVKSFLEK